MTIRVGDNVYRTEFIGSDVTTHPGVPGIVTWVIPATPDSPSRADVTFSLGSENVWYRTVRVENLTVFIPKRVPSVRSATMTCNECGASFTATTAEVLAWDAQHDTNCPRTD